ncbi:MAG: hypothetical protein ABW174_15010 [Flavitalea sp.]
MYLLFTPEELIQYLYKETSHEKTVAIENALREDWTLREKLEVLKASHRKLDTILESPRAEVIMNILNYARTTEVNSVS